MKKWTGERMILAHEERPDGSKFTLEKMPIDRQWVYGRIIRILKEAKNLDDPAPIGGHPTSWRQYLLLLIGMLKIDDLDNAEMLEGGRRALVRLQKQSPRRARPSKDVQAVQASFNKHLSNFNRLSQTFLVKTASKETEVPVSTIRYWLRNGYITIPPKHK